MIKKLEKDFVKNRYDGWDKPVRFIQIEETETAYLYKREIGDYTDYEVFLKRNIRDRRKNNGFLKEKYPNIKDFGKWAWSYIKLENAQKKLRMI